MTAAAIQPLNYAQARRPAYCFLRALLDGRHGSNDGWMSGQFLRHLYNLSAPAGVILPDNVAADVLAGLASGGFVEARDERENADDPPSLFDTTYRITRSGIDLIDDMRTFEAARSGCPSIWRAS